MILAGAAAVAVAVLIGAWPPPVVGAQFEVIRLTENSYDDVYPAVRGDLIAWHGCPANDCTPFGGNYEVYLYDGADTVKISESPFNDWYSQVTDSWIVWRSRTEEGEEIMAYRRGAVEQLSAGSLSNANLRAQGRWATWQGIDAGGDSEIYLHDGISLVRLTNNDTPDEVPTVWGGEVAWVGCPSGVYPEGNEIYFYDGIRIRRLTSNETEDGNPEIWNGMVAWEGFDGNDWEIYLFDGTEVVAITDNYSDDRYPCLNDGVLVWQGMRQGNNEILVYEGGEEWALTFNNFSDERPRVSGRNVVWFGCPGNDCPFFISGNWEIYHGDLDSGVVTRLTFNDDSDSFPEVDGSTIVWMGRTEEQMEIFMARITGGGPTPTPTPTPAPTGTPAPMDFELILNQPVYQAGDRFLLRSRIVNGGGDTLAEMYIVLDVYGEYYFWPSWIDYPPNIDFRLQTIPGGGTLEETILDFTWPSGVGSGQHIVFWGAILDAATGSLLSQIASAVFNFV
jgi:hypothetical protein